MKWMNSRSQWLRVLIYTIGIASLLFVFFYLLPTMLPYILALSYTQSDMNAAHPLLERLGQIGDSYGIYNTLFSALAFGGVLLTLYHQNRNERKASLVDKYYKMLDFQQNLINEMTVMPIRISPSKEPVHPVRGRKVFVEYKMQLKYLMKAINDISNEKHLGLTNPDIADIAYAVFYYGSNSTWKDIMKEYLKDYPQRDELIDSVIEKLKSTDYRRFALNRTNQNYMSVYGRNLYNAIKLIDSSDLLTEAEKTEYIKILRAQLCNAELYVLFFNFLSRFGKKWIDYNYVEKYQLIQNLPSKYCDGYSPKDYFPNISFEGESEARSPFHETIERRD